MWWVAFDPARGGEIQKTRPAVVLSADGLNRVRRTNGPSLNSRTGCIKVVDTFRAMGFDTGYKLLQGSRRDRIKLLGNGVCPPVMRQIVAALTGVTAGSSHARSRASRWSAPVLR